MAERGDPEEPHIPIVGKINRAIVAQVSLTLSPGELGVLAEFVNHNISAARGNAKMVEIISQRAYGQQSELQH